MPLDKEKVQDLIDDFVVTNVDQINEVATDNPMLYGAVIDALNLLSRKFGTIQAINIPKPAAPKAIELNPIVQVGAKFKQDNGKLIEIIQIDIDNNNLGGGIVTYEREGKLAVRNMNFVEINNLIESGGLVLVPQAKSQALNPLVKIGEVFEDTNTKGEIITITDIDHNDNTIKYDSSTKGGDWYISFDYVNNFIDKKRWVPNVQPQAPKLNPLVEIGAEFIEGQSVIKIEDIDYDKEEVMLSGTIVMGTLDVKFYFINDKIESGKWVLKTQTIPQSNTFGALTLNPSVKVGQLYLDLEDDSNFSVVLIDPNKQVVTIYWNEDDLQGEVDFEDFNDNLEAATWVLAPDKTQGPNTEAEILEAIEGLELIDDDESKKEIAELKKQLKQLKKKKP
jgi:hypothetical protein